MVIRHSETLVCTRDFCGSIALFEQKLRLCCTVFKGKNNVSDNTDKIHSAPPSLKSKVWRKFGFYKNNRKLEKGQAICQLCRTGILFLDVFDVLLT